MSNFQIKNEEQRYDGGFVRSIVIDVDTNHPRPVWRSDRSNGNSPLAGTYQQAHDNDIVIIVTIDPVEKVKLNFCIIENGTAISTPPDFNFHPVINAITSLVREWLYDTSPQPYLPKGVGWDGENPEIEKIKMEKAISVLPKGIPAEHLKPLMAAISFTPINVFNDVKISTRTKKEVVVIPDCHLYIQADKDNNVISISQPVFDLNTDGVPIAVHGKTSKLYIIWYTALRNNASKKIELEIIELV